MSVVSYAIKKKKFNPCDTDYLETALLVHKPFDKTRGTERKTKTGGGFIIYAFLLFKQPHILQYIKRVIDSGARTISSICSKLSCFLSENNVSGDIDRVHPFVHLHSISPPVVSSLFFSIPLPVLMQSAPRHSLPVTSTRERTQGKRSTARRQGVKTLIDHLFRTFSPSLLFFFLLYARRRFIPRLTTTLQFLFFALSLIYTLCAPKLVGKQKWTVAFVSRDLKWEWNAMSRIGCRIVCFECCEIVFVNKLRVFVSITPSMMLVKQTNFLPRFYFFNYILNDINLHKNPSMKKKSAVLGGWIYVTVT